MNYKDMWRNLHVLVQPACKAGLNLHPKPSWHNPRKSFATNFMERCPGRSWVLMDMMRHVSPIRLHRYVKDSRAYCDQALNQIAGELVPDLVHRVEGAV